MKNLKRMNWRNIESDISEARAELQSLEKDIAASKKLNEYRFEVSLRHAYFHLNFAWNARHVETKKYIKLTDSNFKKWGKFPKGFDEW